MAGAALAFAPEAAALAPEALGALESGGGKAIMSKETGSGLGSKLEEVLNGSSNLTEKKSKDVAIGSTAEPMNVASNTASSITDRVDPATNYFTNRDKNKLITQVAELLVSYICNTMISSPGYSNSGANLETKIIGLVETKLHDIFESDDQNAPDGPEKLKDAIIEGVSSIFNKLSGNTVLLYSMILENEETELISNALTIVFRIAYDKATDPNTPDETGFMQSLFSNNKENFMASFLSQVMITVQNPIDVLPELQRQQTIQRGGNVRRTNRQLNMRKKNKTRKSSNKKYHKRMVLRKKSRKYKGKFVKNRKVKSQKIRQVGGIVGINADDENITNYPPVPSTHVSSSSSSAIPVTAPHVPTTSSSSFSSHPAPAAVVGEPVTAKLEANRQQHYRQQQHQSTANQSQGQGQGQSSGQGTGQECVMPDPNSQQYLGEYTEELFEKLSSRLNDSENELLNKILTAVMQILMDSSSPIIAKIAEIVENVNLPENMGSMSTSILACNLLNAENEVFGNAVKHAYTETYKSMKAQIEGSEKQVSTRFVTEDNFIQTVIEHMRNALHIILYAENA